MCLPFTEGEVDLIGALNKPYARKNTATSEFRPFFDTRLSGSEILKSFALPFRYWKSLILCGFLFVFLTLGVSTALLGEASAFAISGLCSLVGFTLAFGILWKVASVVKEHRGKGTFLPTLIHAKSSFGRPIRAGVLVLCVTFGPFAALLAGSGIYAWFQFSDSVRLVESKMRTSEEETARLLSVDEQKRIRDGFENRLVQKREALLNSVLGRERSNESPAFSIAVQSFMRLSVIFLLPVGLAFMFGLITFPGACALGVDSEEPKHILNPLSVFRMLKRTGFDYFKILFISIVAFVVSVAGSVGIVTGLNAVDIPVLAFAVAIAFVGAFAIYFWIVFSRLLATAVYS